jgi:hypothetical protein
VPLPDLAIGLVVRYEYLWHRRSAEGADTADKDRPACVAFTFDDGEKGRCVMLLPITHSPPRGPEVGVEIPLAVKRHLGLDHDRSWIVVSECNIDVWPNPDLRAVPGRPGVFAYGHIPPRLFRTVREAFLDTYRSRRAGVVRRFE